MSIAKRCPYCFEMVVVPSRKCSIEQHVRDVHSDEWAKMKLRCNTTYPELKQEAAGTASGLVEQCGKVSGHTVFTTRSDPRPDDVRVRFELADRKSVV